MQSCSSDYFYEQALFHYSPLFCEEYLKALIAFENGEVEIAIQATQSQTKDLSSSILELTFLQDQLTPSQFQLQLKQFWELAFLEIEKAPWVPLVRLSKNNMTRNLWSWLENKLKTFPFNSSKRDQILQAEDDLVSMGFFSFLSHLKSGHPLIQAYDRGLFSFREEVNQHPLAYFDPFGHLALFNYFRNKGDLPLAQSWFRICEDAVNKYYSETYLNQLARLHQQSNFKSKQWELQQLKHQIQEQWNWLYEAQNQNSISLKSRAGIYWLGGLAGLLFLSFLLYYLHQQSYNNKVYLAEMARTEKEGLIQLQKEKQQALAFSQNLSQKTILPFIQKASDQLFSNINLGQHQQLSSIKSAIDTEIGALQKALSNPGITDKARWAIYRDQFPRSPVLHCNDLSESEWPFGVSGLLKELSTNSLKHAKCTQIKINIREENSDLLITYQDNGCGLQDLGATGTGLKNLDQTMQKLGGKMELKGKGGFHAKICFPI